MRRDRRAIGAWAWTCAVCAACAAVGQTTNPVYVDDSPAAADTLARAPQLAASGNLAEAVRALQRILEEEPDRVAPDSGPGADPEVFTGVRRRVHRELLADPALLEEYRRGAEPRAAALLAAGDIATVEQSYLLTPSGFRAALRLAQAQMESAAFESARLTLEQLQDHPERRAPGAGGKEAGVMLRRLAAYIDRPEVWALADAWAKEAGLAAEGRATVAPPPAAAIRALTPLAAPLSGEGPLAANIPPTALWTVSVEDREVVPGDEGDARARAGAVGAMRGMPAATDQRLWIFPTIVGDLFLVNNGSTVRAWDRYTLEPRWTAKPESDPTLSPDELDAVADERQSRRRGQQREDTASVSVAGRLVLATTGLATDGTRLGDDRVHAIDAATGRVVWSAAPWMVDPQLNQGSVRGPVLAGEGVAVVAVRKSIPPRRVVSMYLVGLDLRTGAEKWVRLVGSAGALPNQRERRVADSGVLDRGVVYTTDPVGVAAAVEAATGRPLWVRRVPSTDIGYVSGSPGQTWESSGPVVSGDSVFVLSTDRDQVLQLDRATGRVRASRRSDTLNKPGYLLGVNGVLVAVGRDRLAMVDMDRFEAGPVRLSDRIEAEGGIRGRVVASAGRLVVPTVTGALVIDPAGPKPAAVGEIPLDKPGILLPAGDQIVAVDDRDIRSYLGWDAADRLLTARMAANPDDPRPAVSYADLAYRAGRPSGIAQAADRALGAIERDPGTEANQAARARLFASLREMVESAQAAWTPPAAGAPTQARPRTDLTREQVGALVVRLGRAAASHQDRVVHLLCLGRLQDASGAAVDAVEAYQEIMTSPALAGAAWASLADPAVTVSAGAEAARRLREVVIASGRGVYSAFDAEVEAELAALGEGEVRGEALAALVAKYPAARAAAAIWERAADAYRREGRTGAEVMALGSALEAAELSVAIGPSAAPGRAGDPMAELAEAAGRLVRALQRAGRPETAAQTLARVRTKWPGAALSERGATLDAGALRQELDAAMAGPIRAARIGVDVGEQEQQFADWSLLRPMDPASPTGSPEHVVMASEVAGQVALFGVDFGEDAGAPRGRLRMLWSRPIQDLAPVLIRSDPDAVYLAWLEPDGGTIRALERINPVGGQTRWRTRAPAELMPEDRGAAERMTDGNGAVTRLETRQGPRFISQVIVLIDGGSVALVERTGRVVVLDAATGEARAKFVSPVGAVYDATAARGVMALAGTAAPPRAVQEEPRGVAAVHDMRTGGLVRSFTDLPDQVGWLRLSAGGRLLLALRTEIVARDLATGAEAWAMQVSETRDAWVSDAPGFENAIFLLTRPDRELYFGSLRDGSVAENPIDVGTRLDAMSRIDAAVVGAAVVGAAVGGGGVSGRPEGSLALMNSKGVVLLSASGQVVGMDALRVGESLVPPVAAEGSFVALQTQEVILPDDRPTYRLSLLSTASAAVQAEYDLVLWAVPTRAAVVDGRIVVTAGRMTVVYPAP